jgi:hypothetical protein
MLPIAPPAHRLPASPGPGRASSDQKPPEWRVILGVFSLAEKKMANAVAAALAISFLWQIFENLVQGTHSPVGRSRGAEYMAG